MTPPRRRMKQAKIAKVKEVFARFIKFDEKNKTGAEVVDRADLGKIVRTLGDWNPSELELTEILKSLHLVHEGVIDSRSEGVSA